MKLIVARDSTTAEFIAVALGIESFTTASVGVCPLCSSVLVSPFTEETTATPQLINDAAQAYVLDPDAFLMYVECVECQMFVEPEWH